MCGPVSVACVTDKWASWAVAVVGVLGPPSNSKAILLSQVV